MAVLDCSPGLEVEIVVNDTPLAEYVDQDEENPAKTTIKYVEAVSGAEFSVKYRFDTSFHFEHDCSIHIYVDGKWADSHVHYAGGKLPKASSFEGTRNLIRNKYEVQKFCFSQLDIDDNCELRTVHDNLKKQLKDIGTISVRAYWIRADRTSASRPKQHSTSLSVLGKVPEKALKGKALSHQASLKQPEPTPAFSIVRAEYLTEPRMPFATIDFRYRSKAALQALLLIPREPDPVPLEGRDIETLDPQEMRELLKRQREREGYSRAVKRERSETIAADGGETGDDDGVTFVSAKRRRQVPVTINEAGVEILDLT